MTAQQVDFWIAVSEKFGTSDLEFFLISTTLVVDLIIAIVAYKMLIKLWRIYKAKRQANAEAC